jgi:hypothetical protein
MRMRLPWRNVGSRLAAVIGVSCLFGAVPTRASETEAEAAPVRDYVNLRAGVSTGSKRLEMCLEVSPLAALSVEACGTGSEFLASARSPELAHYRAKYTLTQWLTDVGWIQPRVGLGFTELQVDEDDPGFQFFGVGPRGAETAGPEASLGLRGLYPLGSYFELVGELSFSMAWLKYAPQLATPQPRFQPAVSFTLGGGF